LALGRGQKADNVDKLKGEVDQGLKDAATSLSGPSWRGHGPIRETREGV